MQERIGELGTRLVMFAAAGVIVGIVGVVLGVPDALDGEWTGIAGVVVGVLGIIAAVMIWTGANAGSGLDGMNLGMLWAVAHVPYVHVFDRDDGTDLTYPVPDFGAIFTFGSSTSINGQVVEESVWGIGFLGVILLIAALVARNDWNRLSLRRRHRGSNA